MGSKYQSGNNLPRISEIRGKLLPDRYSRLLILTAFVVVSRVGCRGVSGVICIINKTHDLVLYRLYLEVLPNTKIYDVESR